MGGNVPAETVLSQPVHFGHFGRKRTGRDILFLLRRYILVILGVNVPAGMFSSQEVHFGHFGRKCTRWEAFTLKIYIFPIWGENGTG